MGQRASERKAKVWRVNRSQKTTRNMKAKRRRHDPQFKSRVAIEALKGIKTVQQTAREYEVHPAQVADWKKTMQEGVAMVFERGGTGACEEDFERERQQLKAIIGDLTVKLEFLTKKSKQLGL